jgi:hypothetical protein
MRYRTERRIQTVFLLVGLPLSGLLFTRRHPEINSMKCDGVPRLRARRLAACGYLQIGTRSLALGQASVNSRWVNNTIPRPPRSLGPRVRF